MVTYIFVCFILRVDVLLGLFGRRGTHGFLFVQFGFELGNFGLQGNRLLLVTIGCPLTKLLLNVFNHVVDLYTYQVQFIVACQNK